MEVINWESFTQGPELRGDGIHIWRSWLSLDSHDLKRLRSYLTSDEQDRAARFRFDRDRNRYIVARGILRTVLGLYLQKPPESLRFRYGPRGKPSLDLVASPQSLEFNLSHSDDLALFAIGWNRNLGVDVEQIRPNFGGEEIAQRYFSAAEAQALVQLPVEDRPAGFFKCWTRKEAYIKASGEGLQIPFDSFDVSPALGVSESSPGGADPRWRMWAFSPAPNYAAALVSDGWPSELSFFHWNP
jgi:4'-phosphopantetheinyl transferase